MIAMIVPGESHQILFQVIKVHRIRLAHQWTVNNLHCDAGEAVEQTDRARYLLHLIY